MTKADFEDYICRYFCDYYRAGDKEKEACQGARVLARMVRAGRLTPQEFPRGAFMIPPPAHDPLLDQAICSDCPFRAADCDFQATPAIPDSLPCGGYRLLALMRQRHCLGDEDLHALAHG